jgi:hypothetical protein
MRKIMKMETRMMVIIPRVGFWPCLDSQQHPAIHKNMSETSMNPQPLKAIIYRRK